MQTRLGRYLRNILILYAVSLLLLTLFQREFIYFPMDGPTDPAAAGLEGFAAHSFTAADGVDILYWESEGLPATAPTLLYFHGNGGGLHMFVPYLKALAAKGVRVAAMEYRGYPGVECCASETSIVADATQFVRHMAKTHTNSPLMIWGYSLGSGIAVQATAKSQDIDIAHLILEAPFTSVVERAGEMMPWVPTHYLMWERYDSISVIKDIGTPLTIIHGTHDPLIPFKHGQALFQAANQPKRLITVQGADHWNLLAHGAYDEVTLLPDQQSLN